MISSYGKVYSNITNKFIAPQPERKGYLSIQVRLQNGKPLGCKIHRLVMMEFCPVPNMKNLQVNHKDGDKTNNHISNLEWCDQSYNIRHADQHGLRNMPAGEKVHNATITDAQAEQIAQMLTESRWTYDEIANIIGCTRYPVADIACGKRSPWLYDKYNLEKYKHKGKKLYLHRDND